MLMMMLLILMNIVELSTGAGEHQQGNQYVATTGKRITASHYGPLHIGSSS